MTLWRKISFVFSTLLVFSACVNEQSETPRSVDDLDVHIQVQEEQKVGEEVPLQVQLLEGQAYVEDVDQVRFDVFEKEQTDTVTTKEARYVQDGVFRSSIELDDAGEYVVEVIITNNGGQTSEQMTVVLFEE
ncbi:FixH family protein [Shouchella sp. JSM 1781072]|uniref:FixH family protein n=1 Tax=Shouchella sp. JSM 1781072 TaxID=3344581 RepID=UPI0035C11F7E